MLNRLKKPCDECPFRTNALPGWLGGETPETTYDHIMTEGDFSCHKTRHKAVKEQDRCRGSLLFLRQACKIPRYNVPLKEALMKIDWKNIQGILRQDCFIEYHTI